NPPKNASSESSPSGGGGTGASGSYPVNEGTSDGRGAVVGADSKASFPFTIAPRGAPTGRPRGHCINCRPRGIGSLNGFGVGPGGPRRHCQRFRMSRAPKDTSNRVADTGTLTPPMARAHSCFG